MLARVALLFHAAVEAPAAATFLFFPERQLSTSTTLPLETALVLQNLGGLLAVSVGTSLVLAIWGAPPRISYGLRGALCLCLASYHVFPSRRAYLRLKHGLGSSGGPAKKTLGGPVVHLAVHSIGLVLLTSAGIADVMA